MSDEENKNAEEKQSADGEEQGGEEGEGSSGKKKLLLILIPILLLGGGGAGAYFSGMLGGETTEEHAVEGGEDGEDGASGEHAAEGEGGEGHAAGGDGEGGEPGVGGVFFPVEDIVVNLNSRREKKQRHLRLSIQLELNSEADSIAIEKVMPRVRDKFQTYLRELRVADLEGSAGIYRLKMELLFRVNNAVHPIEVKEVLFQEMLIQ